MLAAVLVTFVVIYHKLDLNISGLITEIKHSNYGQMFFFDDFREKTYFYKQFLSGILIAVVMTGLDQDMMQKNLSCRNLKEAQKNILSYSVAFVPVNLLFLTLGALLAIYAGKAGIILPGDSDELFPKIALEGGLPITVSVLFMLGLIAAAYSSADSALTSLTTVFTIDILRADRFPEDKMKKFRMLSHVLMSLLLLVAILLFRKYSNDNVINVLFTAAAYTYGPLLGLFFFGLFIRRKVKDVLVPVVVILAPVFCYLITKYTPEIIKGYTYGYEFLLINGGLTVLGLILISVRKN
jgi:solute:Na+ symporter, SSS family